jgi:hypothetical protein
VVQPGQDWDSDNGAGPLDCPTGGGVFAKRQVRAHLAPTDLALLTM